MAASGPCAGCRVLCLRSITAGFVCICLPQMHDAWLTTNITNRRRLLCAPPVLPRCFLVVLGSAQWRNFPLRQRNRAGVKIVRRADHIECSDSPARAVLCCIFPCFARSTQASQVCAWPTRPANVRHRCCPVPGPLCCLFILRHHMASVSERSVAVCNHVPAIYCCCGGAVVVNLLRPVQQAWGCSPVVHCAWPGAAGGALHLLKPADGPATWQG